ncbi:MAG: hypothetical protein A3F54_00235 [Candidatus Kerfeldbacteria bacterium RIFCSPHIGHO2_12_FULL_48_17]|uniref:Uncharacterized protein n=1 Tax=Candidatus Kerfeldbacteria bacterium RIFCSPHIGHO2_12_FULL_48_17 TaxID=1798542 RepID=A0A1G2B0F2_9BACT|nr:MAG: hypothetical protein A3F54_00235 [Candidatus Kerfeldbacteria bacterium RIFCSPHIGHO2_12_FULL_48_17]
MVMKILNVEEYTLHGQKFVKAPISVFNYRHFVEEGPSKRSVQIMCEQAMKSLAETHCLYIADPPITDELDKAYTEAIPEAFRGKLIATDMGVANSGKRDAHIEQARPYPSWLKRIQPGHEPFGPPPDKDRRDSNVRLHFAAYNQKAEDIAAFPNLNTPTIIPPELEKCREVVLAWNERMREVARVLHSMIDVGLGWLQGTMIGATKIDEGPCLVAPTLFTVNTRYDGIWHNKQFEHADDSWGTLHRRPFSIQEMVARRMDAVVAHIASGHRILPEVPEGMLFFQAGIFLEYMLGGLVGRCPYPVKAGLHCATITPWIWDAAVDYAQALHQDLKRFAGVFFIQPKTTMPARVLPQFSNAASRKAYPELPVGLVMNLSFYGTGVLDVCPEFPLDMQLPHDLEASPRIQKIRQERMAAS